MKQKDPTTEQISSGCLWLIFALGSLILTAVVAGLSVRIFLAISGVG